MIPFWTERVRLPRITGLPSVVRLLAAYIFLSGCDDYERELAMADYRERFMEACMPRKGDLVTAEWVKGKLVCQRTTPTGRYGPTFPHTENRIAIVEPM